MATAGIFDNLRLAVQVHGQKSYPSSSSISVRGSEFRITNMHAAPRIQSDINDGLPENDIVRSRADFIISDTDWRYQR